MQQGGPSSFRFLNILLGLFIGVIIGWLAHIVYSQRLKKEHAIPETAQTPVVSRENELVLPEGDFSPNEEKILTEIIRRGTVKQADLPNIVDLSRSNVSEVIARLKERKYIKRVRKGRTFLIEHIKK
ncbi:MAG: helix-turn-helix transcriptional regulator [Candidatus Heimdallarchaeota archaeon]